MIFIVNKDFKTRNNTQLGALAGQIQHMAAQKAGFTPRPIRYGPPNMQFQAQLHWNLHSRAELETCKLGGSYPRSIQKPYHFWPQCPPSATLPQYLDWKDEVFGNFTAQIWQVHRLLLCQIWAVVIPSVLCLTESIENAAYRKLLQVCVVPQFTEYDFKTTAVTQTQTPSS
jgi:hypothetical protein